jgi:hypothetical protein
MGLAQMRRDVFDVGKYAVLLEEPTKIVCDNLSRKLAACRLPAGVHHNLVYDVAAVLRPFVEEIEDIVEASDLLNKVLPLGVNRVVKGAKCHVISSFRGVQRG